MKNSVFAAIIILALAGTAYPVFGATYYVSPSGSNTSPYDTWAEAAVLPTNAIITGNGTAGPHTMYIAPGTYDIAFGTISNANWASGTIIGTAAHGSTAPATKGQGLIVGTGDHMKNPVLTVNFSMKY